MPRAKKTTDAEPVKPSAKAAAKPKAAKPKPKAKTPTSTTSAAAKVASLEKRLNETEDKLNSLINIIHNDLDRGQRQGPEGLASKLRKAGLLS